MDSVLCGATMGLDKIDLQGLRLGVPRVDFYQGADTEVLDAMEALLAQLSRARCDLGRRRCGRYVGLERPSGFSCGAV
jgi:hypothetical protein